MLRAEPGGFLLLATRYRRRNHGIHGKHGRNSRSWMKDGEQCAVRRGGRLSLRSCVLCLEILCLLPAVLWHLALGNWHFPAPAGLGTWHLEIGPSAQRPGCCSLLLARVSLLASRVPRLAASLWPFRAAVSLPAFQLFSSSPRGCPTPVVKSRCFLVAKRIFHRSKSFQPSRFGMGLTSLDLRNSYRTGRDDLVQGFIVPCHP